MLKIFTVDGTDAQPLEVDDKTRFVTHKYDGKDTLTFELANIDIRKRSVNEETIVQDEKNRYVVKNIDEHSNFVTVTCELDLDDWKRTVRYSYRKTNVTLAEVLSDIIPSGWTHIGAEQYTKRTTVEGNVGEPIYVATPLEILNHISEAFDCIFNFDVLSKKLIVINVNVFQARGVFFSDELNLRSLGFVGNSDKFATRLFAYGAIDETTGEPITFADINDGKSYVEDYTYSNKIVSVGWKDERFTNKQNLLDEAIKLLTEISFPTRSYECEVAFVKDVNLYDIITLIDRKRGTRVNHRIIEYREYPEHNLDTVVLSATQPRISSVSEKTIQSLQNDIASSTSVINKNVSALDKAVLEIIVNMGKLGGAIRYLYDEEGLPIALLIVCTNDKIWKWDDNGLSYSSSGLEGQFTQIFNSDGTASNIHIIDDILFDKTNMSIERYIASGQLVDDGKLIELMLPLDGTTKYDNIETLSVNICVRCNGTNLLTGYNSTTTLANITTGTRTRVSLNDNADNGYVSIETQLINKKFVLIKLKCYTDLGGSTLKPFSSQFNNNVIIANIENVEIGFN